MIREKSCGAIIYSRVKNEIKYLIVQMNLGHFSFAKGHMEGDETEVETALREVKEETGLDVKIDTDFRKTVEYSPYVGCIKEVVYFLATPTSGEIVRQEEEIKSIQWLSFEDAFTVLTHEVDKVNLKEADIYLKDRKAEHYENLH